MRRQLQQPALTMLWINHSVFAAPPSEAIGTSNAKLHPLSDLDECHHITLSLAGLLDISLDIGLNERAPEDKHAAMAIQIKELGAASNACMRWCQGDMTGHTRHRAPMRDQPHHPSGT
jgi:hypothetical protein